MILYIHPKTEITIKESLPISMVALMNRVPFPVKGRYHDEWTPEEVRQAQVVVMDVHWYISLPSAIQLSFRLKQINPKIQIVAGGLTASLFAEFLLRDSRIDYIIRGDGEIPLVRLLEALVNQTSLEQVPNLICRDFVSRHTYRLTAEVLNQSNFRDISFFPSFERRVNELNRHFNGHAFPFFPYLMVYRGCPMTCVECYGSVEIQDRIFQRRWVLRSAENVRDDLIHWSENPNINYVSIFHDFVSLLSPTYEQTVLSRRYDLHVYFEVYRCPLEDRLGLFLDSFRGGKIMFSLDQHHTTSSDLPDLSSLIQRIKQAQATRRYQVVLAYVKRFTADPVYRQALETVTKATGCSTYQADFWWELNPVPDSQGKGTEEDYNKCSADRGGRYWMMNNIYRTGVKVHRYFPRFTKTVANWWMG